MTITQADIDATERGETLWGTTRCLPKEHQIPKQFLVNIHTGTIYNRMIDAWYSGTDVPDGEVSFNPGFKPDGKALKGFIMAHLNSLIPEYKHKVAGTAYLLSQVITIKE